MFIRIISFIFLLLFIFSSLGEAKHHTSPRHARHPASTTNKKIKKPTIRKKREALAPRKRPQRASRSGNRSRTAAARQRQPRKGAIRKTAPRKRPQRASRAGNRSRTAAARQRQLRTGAIRKIAPSKLQSTGKGRRRPLPLPIAPPSPIVPPAPPPTYLSQLKPHTQRNAQLGGLDKLYPKKNLGLGITVAVIEQSGTWTPLRDLNNNPLNNLSPERRENYRNNFLPAIGGPGLPPEETNASIRAGGHLSHGADVSSVVLDFSPRAKVLPVSTYKVLHSPDAYDVADAVKDLSQRTDVNIINISSGYINFTVTSQAVRDDNGGLLYYVSKTVYTPKLVEAFRAVAQAGKVVVLAAGNEGNDIKPPAFCRFSEYPNDPKGETMGHLMETLDPETRQSVIFAGAFDPETCVANDYSNKPGNWPEAQERFLFAPGRHLPAYSDFTVGGTSYASPYICAALADLCSMPGVTPKRAVKALLETADQRPEKAIYGRGVIRADRAAEWLEAGYQ